MCHRGFTLIEILAASIATLALGGVMMTLYTTMANGLEIAQVRADVTSNLRNAFEQIGRDMQAAWDAGDFICSETDYYETIDSYGNYISTFLKTPPGYSPTGNYIIYECKDWLSGETCRPDHPGDLVRLVDSNCWRPPNETRVVAHNVTLLDLRRETLSYTDWWGPSGDADQTRYAVTLGVTGRIREGGFEYTDQLTDRFTMRGRK